MRAILAAGALCAALLTTSAHAVTVLDTGGFEGFTPGAVVGQNGWGTFDNNGNTPDTAALIAAAPGGGQAICFDNIGKTESSVTVPFATNLKGTYRYADVSFSVYREGNNFYNNLWWWPNGNNPYYGLVWDAAAGNNAPTSLVMPFGFGKANAPMPASQWVDVHLLYDLQAGTGSSWVNGVAVDTAANIDVGTEFLGWSFVDEQTVDPARSPNAVGQRGYVDNLVINAGNTLDELKPIPEPSSLALLAGALPLLGLRRRKV